MPQDVLSITQVNEYIRGRLDQDPLLSGLAIRGEISNYKIYPSGHHYFTLKDDSSSLRCVMFKGNTMRLRFHPENGMKIIAMGKISVYPRDGAYQFYCTAMTVDGVGDLHVAFEQLKEKLEKQGYFDQSHKKPLPKYPKVVGIVTSSAGAAVHDILRILNKRYPLAEVKLFPVRVQGVEAPAEIAGAIYFANHHKAADLLIVGRGGGSIEDLWAFNDELVAKAIYDSEIPIISAVGHEPDVTIADYVADVRAATPSNGAELAVPDQDGLRQTMDAYLASISTSLTRQIKAARKHLEVLSSSQSLRSPEQYISVLRKSLSHQNTMLLSLQKQIVSKNRQRFLTSAAKLDAMSPLKVLTRGYSLAQNSEGMILRSIKQVKPTDIITVSVCDGTITATVTETKGDKYE